MPHTYLKDCLPQLNYFSYNPVGARYYDAVLGVWMSKDPARQFANPYNGLGNNLVNGVDPDGRLFGKTWDGIVNLVANDPVISTGLSLSRGEDMGDQSFWMSAADGGTLPGALAIAGVTSTISFANRLVAPDNEDRWGTITDHVSGGATMDYFGNTLGAFNTASGGKELYYQGFVVYGDDGAIPIEGGFEHFGHALFAQDLDNKAVINHEIRHAKQMEKRGNRIGYYRDNYGWFWGDGVENCGHMAVDTECYDSNKYEIDAYYSSWLYEQGAVDIYGRKKKDGRLKDWKHSDDNVRLKFIEYYNTEIQKRTNNGLGERSPSDNPFQLPTDWQWRETYFTGPGF